MWNIQHNMVSTLADMNADANFRPYLQMMSVRSEFGEHTPTLMPACRNLAKQHGIPDPVPKTNALAITGHEDQWQSEDAAPYWGQDLPMKQPPMGAPHMVPPDMAQYKGQTMEHGNPYGDLPMSSPPQGKANSHYERPPHTAHATKGSDWAYGQETGKKGYPNLSTPIQGQETGKGCKKRKSEHPHIPPGR